MTKRHGFELIDFVLVIAIIGILAAIAIPKFVESCNKTKEHDPNRFMTNSSKQSQTTGEPTPVAPPVAPPLAPPEFVLANGQKLTCEKGRIVSCGVLLTNCSDGMNYSCLQGVSETNEQYKAGR